MEGQSGFWNCPWVSAVEGCLLSGIVLVLAYNTTPSSSGKYVICSTRLTIGRYLDFCSFILWLPPITSPSPSPPPHHSSPSPPHHHSSLSLHSNFQSHYENLEQAESKANFLRICVIVEPHLTDTPEQRTPTI